MKLRSNVLYLVVSNYIGSAFDTKEEAEESLKEIIGKRDELRKMVAKFESDVYKDPQITSDEYYMDKFKEAYPETTEYKTKKEVYEFINSTPIIKEIPISSSEIIF